MFRKKATCAGLAFILSVMTLISGNPAVSYAAYAPTPVYEFDHSKKAVDQLEDLFTTIDIMDATAAGLTEEMEKGNVTSEQLVQMYIDRIKAYDKKEKLNSIISINPNALEEAREGKDQADGGGLYQGRSCEQIRSIRCL